MRHRRQFPGTAQKTDFVPRVIVYNLIERSLVGFLTDLLHARLLLNTIAEKAHERDKN